MRNQLVIVLLLLQHTLSLEKSDYIPNGIENTLASNIRFKKISGHVRNSREWSINLMEDTNLKKMHDSNSSKEDFEFCPEIQRCMKTHRIIFISTCKP